MSKCTRIPLPWTFQVTISLEKAATTHSSKDGSKWAVSFLEIWRWQLTDILFPSATFLQPNLIYSNRRPEPRYPRPIPPTWPPATDSTNCWLMVHLRPLTLSIGKYFDLVSTNYLLDYVKWFLIHSFLIRNSSLQVLLDGLTSDIEGALQQDLMGLHHYYYNFTHIPLQSARIVYRELVKMLQLNLRKLPQFRSSFPH